MEAVQEFTCLMHGVKNCITVNDARYRIFQKAYAAVKSDNQFLRKIKSFDSTLIPPCWKSLKQKNLRTIFVNSMWLNATDADCIKLNPEECGWFKENHLKPRWFVGDATPLQIDDILQDTCKNNDDDNENEAKNSDDDGGENSPCDNRDRDDYIATSDESDQD